MKFHTSCEHFSSFIIYYQTVFFKYTLDYTVVRKKTTSDSILKKIDN